MWDVIWTDPDKELVGEHRARKEKGGDQKQKKPRARSGRSSVSTASSRSSADSPFSIFRARGLKRINTSSSDAQMASSVSSGPASPSMVSALSPLSRTFDHGSQPSSGRASASLFERRANNIDSPLNHSPLPGKPKGKDDSVFSASPPEELTIASSADDGPMTESEKMTSLKQILGQSSSIAKQAELCLLLPKGSAPGLQGHEDEVASTKKPCSDGPLTPPMSPTKTSSSSSAIRLTLGSPVVIVPPAKSPLRSAAPKWHLPLMPNNLDAWKPPDQWDPIPSAPRMNASERLKEAAPAGKPSNGGSRALQDFGSLHAEVMKMANTSMPDVLSRLKDLWATGANRELQFLLSSSSSSSSSREMTELRLWMLSALKHMDRVPDLTSRRALACKQSPMTARMVLALYESPATVEYLAALDPAKQLYHITTSPTTYEDFSNIRTISASSISPTDFPVAPRLFESVHSLLLPSLCASATLPGILKNVYKCLKVGGTFQLILTDPLPRAGTMGREMRAWIEENLLRNLAKQSRCMSPSTLFPQLLGEAGLRGKGSTLTTTKFYAMPTNAMGREQDVESNTANHRSEREVKAQVRSLVGRMLWVEVWGPYVTADKWWWDEPACVEECLELGTFWEYHTIKAAKGGADRLSRRFGWLALARFAVSASGCRADSSQGGEMESRRMSRGGLSEPGPADRCGGCGGMARAVEKE